MHILLYTPIEETHGDKDGITYMVGSIGGVGGTPAGGLYDKAGPLGRSSGDYTHHNESPGGAYGGGILGFKETNVIEGGFEDAVLDAFASAYGNQYKGIQLELSGRLRGAQRARRMVKKVGSLSQQSFSSKLQFSKRNIYTK